MYRVVTKTLQVQGEKRLRAIDAGPWQPVEKWARQWAEFLQSTGLYDVVEVESNMQDHSRVSHFES